jgi:hypothetical protein
LFHTRDYLDGFISSIWPWPLVQPPDNAIRFFGDRSFFRVQGIDDGCGYPLRPPHRDVQLLNQNFFEMGEL